MTALKQTMTPLDNDDDEVEQTMTALDNDDGAKA